MNVATLLNDLALRLLDIEKTTASGDTIATQLLAIESEELILNLEGEFLRSAMELEKQRHSA